MRPEGFLTTDQLAPALALNDWLRERLRSILDASANRAELARARLATAD